jgi:glycosyltransferase involved in cell wall biosynthesis
MRVAHICQSADPNLGGSLAVARALAREQRELGLDARLVYLYGSDDSPDTGEAGSLSSALPISRATRWTRGIAVLRHWLEEYRPDVIHHHDGILWPRMAASSLKVPLVTHGHVGYRRSNPLAPAWWVHRHIAARTDRLIAVSDWVARTWSESGFPDSRITVVPNGVEPGRFAVWHGPAKARFRTERGLPANRTLLLWAGRLDWETKGLDRLAAVARVLHPSVQAVIVGDGPGRRRLSAALDDLPEARRPIWTGKVADPAPYFSAADAFLFTSRIEAFGLVILEAAACGLPIFAFPCAGGGRELLRFCRARILPDPPWPAGLDGILAEPRDKSELRSIAAEVKQQFSWRAAAGAVARVYRELAVRTQGARGERRS